MPRIRSALSIVCAKDHIYEVSFIHYSASETGEELGKGELVRSILQLAAKLAALPHSFILTQDQGPLPRATVYG